MLRGDAMLKYRQARNHAYKDARETGRKIRGQYRSLPFSLSREKQPTLERYAFIAVLRTACLYNRRDARAETLLRGSRSSTWVLKRIFVTMNGSSRSPFLKNGGTSAVLLLHLGYKSFSIYDPVTFSFF